MTELKNIVIAVMIITALVLLHSILHIVHKFDALEPIVVPHWESLYDSYGVVGDKKVLSGETYRIFLNKETGVTSLYDSSDEKTEKMWTISGVTYVSRVNTND